MRDRSFEELTTFMTDFTLVGTDAVRLRQSMSYGEPLDTASITDGALRNALEARMAVQVEHAAFIDQIASRLALKYSMLCVCDKALTNDLVEWIRLHPALKRFDFARVSDSTARASEHRLEINGLVMGLYQQLSTPAPNSSRVVIIDHLDLMTTNLEGRSRDTANDIVYWLTEFKNVAVLAFADPNLPLPRVIEDVFMERKVLPSLQRDNLYRLLRPEEARCLTPDSLRISDQLRLYQYVSGLNVVRLRWLMRQIFQEFTALSTSAGAEKVYQRIRDLTAVGELQVPTVTEHSLAGYHQTKDDIKKRIIFPMRLRNRAATEAELARADQLIPKGIILYGPPRNGKTEMAKWLANELNAPLIVVRGPELKQMYQGETERAIRRVFAQARSCVPSIILIDELDALTAIRNDVLSRAEASMVAMFLTEMDGLSKDEAILVIGTTNRLEAVDPAFKAPGRFGVLLYVDYPSFDDRLEILKLYREQLGLQDDLNDEALRYLQQQTEGALNPQASNGAGPQWSCDHLRGICKEIALAAEWERDQNRPWPDMNEPAFLDRALNAVRGMSAAAAEHRTTLAESSNPYTWR